MKLNKTQLECLKEMNNYQEYPSYWKPKTRAKLEALGLVEDKNKQTKFAPAAFQLTELGKKVLRDNTAA